MLHQRLKYPKFKCLQNVLEVVCKRKHSYSNYYEVIKQKIETIYLADEQ